jgi:hypothetical protein
VSGHRHDVKNQLAKPVAEHAASHGITDLNTAFDLKIIHSMTEANYSKLRQYELAHQRVLKSRKAEDEPAGLNIR